MSKRPSEMMGVPPEKRQAFFCTRHNTSVPRSNLEYLTNLTRQEMASGSRYPLAVLEGIIRFLKNHQSHGFEGRQTDAKKTKNSFAETEIAAALLLPENRRVEYLVYRFKFALYPTQKNVDDFPLIVAIEPTSLCNLRCIMCFQADTAYFNHSNPKMGYMDIGLYRKLIDEMAENQPCGLVLASRGEPTLHPKFMEMVAYATGKEIIDVKLNTNATALTDKRIRELLEAKPSTVVFSVDAGNKKEFEIIRVGANFDKVIANIKRFNEIRKNEFPNSKTRTRISMTLFRDTQDPEETESLWAPLVDEFALHSASYHLDIYDHPPLPNETGHCSLLWERMYIWWDGNVNPCDMDYKSRLCLGQVGEDRTIRSVWLGEKMQAMRSNHASGKKNDYFPCNQCYGC